MGIKGLIVLIYKIFGCALTYIKTFIHLSITICPLQFKEYFTLCYKYRLYSNLATMQQNLISHLDSDLDHSRSLSGTQFLLKI